MKPMHAELIRVSRCRCCRSHYTRRGMKKTNAGKSATRQNQRRELNWRIGEMVAATVC